MFSVAAIILQRPRIIKNRYTWRCDDPPQLRPAFLPSEEVTSIVHGRIMQSALQSRSTCAEELKGGFLEGEVQENRGKHDVLNGFGKAFGLRAAMLVGRHTVIFIHNRLPTSFCFDIYKYLYLFPALLMPHSLSCQIPMILIVKQSYI